MIDALRDGLAAAADGDRPLCRVGQHLAGHLDGGPGDLANLLDLGAALADERAALRGGDDHPECDRRSRNRVGGH